MRFVPPAMNFAAPREPAFTAGATSCSPLKSNGCTARLLHCLDNSHVATATTDVAAHPLADVFIRSGVSFPKQCRGRADLAGRAVTALETIVPDERRLDGKQPSIAGETFHCHNFLAGVHRSERETGIDPPAVDENRASAARSLIASLFRADDVEMLTHRIEQRGAWIELEAVHLAVHVQRYGDRVGIGFLRRRSVLLCFFPEERSDEQTCCCRGGADHE